MNNIKKLSVRVSKGYTPNVSGQYKFTVDAEFTSTEELDAEKLTNAWLRVLEKLIDEAE